MHFPLKQKTEREIFRFFLYGIFDLLLVMSDMIEVNIVIVTPIYTDSDWATVIL